MSERQPLVTRSIVMDEVRRFKDWFMDDTIDIPKAVDMAIKLEKHRLREYLKSELDR